MKYTHTIYLLFPTGPVQHEVYHFIGHQYWVSKVSLTTVKKYTVYVKFRLVGFLMRTPPPFSHLRFTPLVLKTLSLNLHFSKFSRSRIIKIWSKYLRNFVFLYFHWINGRYLRFNWMWNFWRRILLSLKFLSKHSIQHRNNIRGRTYTQRDFITIINKIISYI